MAWGLRTKLISAFLAVSCLMLLEGGFALYAFKTAEGRYNHITSVNLPKDRVLAEMRGRAREILGLLLQTQLQGTSEAELKRVLEKIGTGLSKYEDSEKIYETLPSSPAEKELYASVDATWKALLAKIQEGRTIAASTDPNAKTKFSENYQGEFYKIRIEFFQKLDKLTEFQSVDTKDRVTDVVEFSRKGGWVILLTMSFGFFFATGFGWVYSGRLSRKLVAIADQVADSATQVTSESHRLTSSSEALSLSITSEAAAIQETTASVEQMNAMVAKSSENVVRSTQVAKESHETAGQGRKVVADMISAMEEINQSNDEVMSAFEKSNQSISEIAQVISEIGNKTRVIDDIVFQTKLLSFNASVEAARAGEHGKGFAVVAEEVGNLATMSGTASQEISKVLSGSMERVSQIVEQTRRDVEAFAQKTSQKVNAGKEIAAQCGLVLDRVVTHASSVNDLNSEIAQAIQEQTQGISEISRAMNQLDHATQSNSTTSQQTAGSAQDLSREAGSLRHSVQELMKLVSGKVRKRAEVSERAAEPDEESSPAVAASEAA